MLFVSVHVGEIEAAGAEGKHLFQLLSLGVASLREFPQDGGCLIPNPEIGFIEGMTTSDSTAASNLDARSLNINYEVLKHCQRIDPATWRKARSLWTKLMEDWA